MTRDTRYVDAEDGEVIASFTTNTVRVNSRYLALLSMNNCWPLISKIDKYVFRFLKFCKEGEDVFLLPNTRRVRREFQRWVKSEIWINEE